MNLRVIATVLTVTWLTACGTDDAQPTPPIETADLVVIGASIYTQDPANPWASAIAVAGGEIVGVGDELSLQLLVGPETRVEDLAGKFVMPGIIDGHAHPAWGGVTAVYFCLFPSTALPAQVSDTISECVAEADDEEVWIQGGLWAADFFAQYQIENPRRWLDAISGDRAIALKDDSGHNYWVNSKALELLGIDENTSPPPGGAFPRTAQGELNGVLIETFGNLLERLPAWTADHYRQGIAYAVENAHGHGVTGWKDASASEPEIAAYFAADQAGELKVHVATCIASPETAPADVDVDRYIGLREKYRSEHVHTNFAKIFLDGIPTTSHTAAMVTAYVDIDEGEPENFGPIHLTDDELADAVTRLDAEGFTVKIHAAGDRSVKAALDAIEIARIKNGESGGRHELAHAGFILPEDIGRFSKLNVVADLSPHLWFPSPIIESVRTALGPRGFEYWPNRDLLNADAQLLVGSDWPSVAPDLNPWIGMEALVTRSDPAGVYPGAGWQEQALTVAESIEVMTLGGARALKLQDRIGSIEVGKSADFIVLDRNLLEIPAADISETQVLATYFEGQPVFTRE
ncbi:MAG: putative amidohydrolase YtcJ [Limisphaerales bacterium]|jgi:predicted amidohydrolase YtcJ